MFRPIQKAEELPRPGEAEGVSLDFKAVAGEKWTGYRYARQVAAFANAIGGSLIIGAVEEQGTDRLKEARPLDLKTARATEKRYGEAVAHLCFPRPLVPRAGSSYRVCLRKPRLRRARGPSPSCGAPSRRPATASPSLPPGRFAAA